MHSNEDTAQPKIKNKKPLVSYPWISSQLLRTPHALLSFVVHFVFLRIQISLKKDIWGQEWSLIHFYFPSP